MIELPVPDDFHHHLRDNDEMKSILPLVVAQFGRAVAMPNLQPPIRTVEDAAAYRSRILNALPAGSTFEPLMTIYLTDSTTAEQIVDAKASGIVVGAKLYPAGATTNSEFGVTSFERLDPALRKMEEVALPLLVHGEVVDSDVDVFDREGVFIERVLKPIVAKHPRLRVVMEHITTKEAVDFILSCCDANGQPRPNIGATITAHHLLYSRNALFLSGIRPHMYCLPILKRESHRHALLRAATSGDPRFFLGTDSAPHSVTSKQSDCGTRCARTVRRGVRHSLDALPAFASVFGQRFYGLPTSPVTVRLVREDWTVPESYPFWISQVRPLRAGEVIRWKKV
jgi:dihydroorotase